MVYVALAQNVIILLLAWALVARERENAKQLLDVIASNEAERAGLLERIQRPEIPPHLHVPRRHTEDDDQARDRLREQAAVMRQVGVARPLRDVAQRAGADA